MSLALFLRSDLIKAVTPPEKVPKEELGRAAARRKGEAFHEPEASQPAHKPSLSGTHYSGFEHAPIHPAGHDTEEHGSVGKVPAGEASGIKESYMKVRPKGKRSTGGKMTGEEMEYARTTTNKPSYHCRGKGCKATVHPPKEIEVGEGKELEGHLQSGGQYEGAKGGMHKVSHPPKLEYPTETGEKQTISLGHHLLKPEMVDHKLCPTCHAKATSKQVVARATGKNPDEAKEKAEAMTKKSMNMLFEMFYMSKAMAEGEDFGKPASSVSEEISHLVHKKGYKQDRAVAAALDMQRRGDIKKDTKKSLYLAL